MLGARASREHFIADGKRAEHQRALVILGQGVHQLREKLNGTRVPFQGFSDVGVG